MCDYSSLIQNIYGNTVDVVLLRAGKGLKKQNNLLDSFSEQDHLTYQGAAFGELSVDFIQV